LPLGKLGCDNCKHTLLFCSECIEKLEKAREPTVDLDRIKELVISALCWDGAHHKQWFLEKIGEALGMDLEQERERLKDGPYYPWERGVAP